MQGKKGKLRGTSDGGQLDLGTLQDPRDSCKGGTNPLGKGKAVVATDVLWSDPVLAPGLHENATRGLGLVYGPDVCQASHLDQLQPGACQERSVEIQRRSSFFFLVVEKFWVL
jgi:hypothetical protein